jgi:hypothetical protein
MNITKIDFDEQDSYGGDVVLPAGKYHVKVVAFERCTASTGTEQIRCVVKILGRPEFDGQEKHEYFPLVGSASWKLRRFFKALTETGSLEGTMDIDSVEFEELLASSIGKTLFVTYGIEEYEGSERNKLRRFDRDKKSE